MSAVVVEYLRFVHAQERRARVRAWLIAATPSSAASGSPAIPDSDRSHGYPSLVVSLRRARRALRRKRRQCGSR